MNLALLYIRQQKFANMGNMGTTELIVIFAIVLLLFGGKKLPGLARSIGQGINEFKRGLSGDNKAEEEPGERDVTPHVAPEPKVELPEPAPKKRASSPKKAPAAKKAKPKTSQPKAKAKVKSKAKTTVSRGKSK